MTKLSRLACGAIFSISVLGVSHANAATYQYTGIITLCGVACSGDIISLQVGSVVEGTIEIDTSPDSAFDSSAIGQFEYTITNWFEPLSDPDPDPFTTNPSYVYDLSTASLPDNFNAKSGPGSFGSTNSANELIAGESFVELIGGVFAGEDAWIVQDLSTGNGSLCASYSDLPELCSGGIGTLGDYEVLRFEGAYELAPEVPVPAAAWLFGSALLGLAGLARRKRA